MIGSNDDFWVEEPQLDPAVKVSIETLRTWYRAARDMGTDPDDLERIKKLGLSATACIAAGGESTVSAEDFAAMHQALDAHEQEQRRLSHAEETNRIYSKFPPARAKVLEDIADVLGDKQIDDIPELKTLTEPELETFRDMLQAAFKHGCNIETRSSRRLRPDKEYSPHWEYLKSPLKPEEKDLYKQKKFTYDAMIDCLKDAYQAGCFVGQQVKEARSP